MRSVSHFEAKFFGFFLVKAVFAGHRVFYSMGSVEVQRFHSEPFVASRLDSPDSSCGTHRPVFGKQH